MMKVFFSFAVLLMVASCKPLSTISSSSISSDEAADRMLLYQRSNGGWPQYNGKPTNYSQVVPENVQKKVASEKNAQDATMDDGITSTEIEYLLEAYSSTNNREYLIGAQKGISYLLAAQNAAGGWPQRYPNLNSYYGHITYNDQAMIDVMKLLKEVGEGKGVYQSVENDLRARAKSAVTKGIQCILKTQVRQQGKLTVWCAQHHPKTLKPAKGRSFEPPSLSGAESVHIVRFLMAIDKPSQEVKTSITSAVSWFEKNRIVGWNFKEIKDSSQPTGRDRVVYKDSRSIIWARFYELNTNRPIFTGKNGVVKYALAEIDNKRRVSYGFYGRWPKRLLNEEYPQWRAKWGK
ncbi:MAG: pectate lyase [Bacteroidota bacterium]